MKFLWLYWVESFSEFSLVSNSYWTLVCSGNSVQTQTGIKAVKPFVCMIYRGSQNRESVLFGCRPRPITAKKRGELFRRQRDATAQPKGKENGGVGGDSCPHGMEEKLSSPPRHSALACRARLLVHSAVTRGVPKPPVLCIVIGVARI